MSTESKPIPSDIIEKEGPGSHSATRPDLKLIFALFFLHFLGDFYYSIVSPLFPVFAEKFSLTLAQVGLITAVSRLLSLVIQPSVGYIADHYRTRVFILGGLLLTIVSLSLVGLAPNYWVLILFVSLGSVGMAMFHPTAAGMVATHAGSRIGFSMSMFNGGGNLAFGVGPVFIAWIVARYGLHATPFVMIPGLLIMALFYKKVPVPREEGLKHLGFFGSFKEVLGKVWKYILLIWVITVLRTFIGQSFATFIPMLYAQLGYSLVSIGLVVSLYNLAGAFSGVMAGFLADRIGYKPIYYVSSILSTPSLLLFLYPTAGTVYVVAFFAGFFIMATLPLAVAMAQELAPKGKSMISSLMMGLAVGTGGMMAPITGKLADLFSIQVVLRLLTFLPIVMIVTIYFLPEIKRSKSSMR